MRSHGAGHPDSAGASAPPALRNDWRDPCFCGTPASPAPGFLRNPLAAVGVPAAQSSTAHPTRPSACAQLPAGALTGVWRRSPGPTAHPVLWVPAGTHVAEILHARIRRQEQPGTGTRVGGEPRLSLIGTAQGQPAALSLGPTPTEAGPQDDGLSLALSRPWEHCPSPAPPGLNLMPSQDEADSAGGFRPPESSSWAHPMLRRPPWT